MNTTYFLNQIMGNVFGSKKDPALPAKYYLGLSTTAPNVDGTGVSEPSTPGDAYARVLIDCFSEPVNGVIQNTASLTFPESLYPWSTAAAPITHYVIYDAPEGGNLLVYDVLSLSRIVETNTVVAIKPESLTITLSNPTEPAGE